MIWAVVVGVNVIVFVVRVMVAFFLNCNIFSLCKCKVINKMIMLVFA